MVKSWPTLLLNWIFLVRPISSDLAHCDVSIISLNQVRKEKLGDRITSLHQLVSPFGKNIVMDRSWMIANRLSDEFDNGVTELLEFAEKNLPNNNGLFPCPCVSCGNRDPKLTKDEIRDHLAWAGICQNYTRWIWHGEVVTPSVSQREKVCVDMDDRLEDMIHDIGEEQNVPVHGSTKGSCSAAQENYKDESTDNVQKVLFMFLRKQKHVSLTLEHDPAVENFWISPKCIKDLLVGTAWLDCSTLQVWCTFIHRLCIERHKSDVFGILDPVVMMSFNPTHSKTKKQVQTYIQSRLRDLEKMCYLAPYLAEGHWQLIIICPRDNTLVVLCSLNNELHSPMKDIVTKAMKVYQLAKGNRKKSQWLRPKARLQPNGNDCGYYVMKNMLDIVSANITKSWMEVFNDPTPLTEEELYDLRNSWATCFLDLHKA